MARSHRDSTFSEASSEVADLPNIFCEEERDGRRYYLNLEARHCYPLPSDEREKERLEVQHQLCLKALGGRLILAPIHAAPQNVLDIGTGLGSWAIDFADGNPSAVVIGIDMVPIQPGKVPPNCQFQIYDAESPWNFNTLFDLIHLGHAETWVRDWPRIARQAFKALKPSGWIELVLVLPWEYNKSTRHHTTIVQYYRDMSMGARALGILLHQDRNFYQQLLNGAGFIKFREQNFYLDSAKMQKLYRGEGLDTFGKGYIGGGLGKHWTELELQLATMRNVLQDSTLEIRFPVSVCYAQKPF